MHSIDTIIIGGGISGLYAAKSLTEKNIPFVLFEAKSRLGGRILTQPTSQDADLGVDLGPTWFWPHQKRIQQLITELNIPWFEQYTAGDVLYQLAAEQAPSRRAGAGVMPSYRIKGGMEKLITALAESLPFTSVKTEHIVSDIAYINGQWQLSVLVAGSMTTFSARRLIMALPPRLITRFLSPEKYLSNSLVQALVTEQTWMSGQAKFVAVYKKPFWRQSGLAGQAFSQVGPMVEIHDASSAPDGGYALFGFLGLSPAARMKMSAQALKLACLKQLEQLFGDQALTPQTTYLNDWATDPWVASPQDINESPRHAEFPLHQHEQELKQLNLHLVASEFAQSEAGYLEGALMAVDRSFEQISWL